MKVIKAFTAVSTIGYQRKVVKVNLGVFVDAVYLQLNQFKIISVRIQISHLVTVIQSCFLQVIQSCFLLVVQSCFLVIDAVIYDFVVVVQIAAFFISVNVVGVEIHHGTMMLIEMNPFVKEFSASSHHNSDLWVPNAQLNLSKNKNNNHTKLLNFYGSKSYLSQNALK